ncbi:MAG: LuxR C-terminal-related transcriptional regulator [Candidatus Moduliflexus flocculans]|nr:LuxR C-terminal-related transcriptional regulator [Candidatus Moduliflexus flocculans]
MEIKPVGDSGLEFEAQDERNGYRHGHIQQERPGRRDQDASGHAGPGPGRFREQGEIGNRAILLWLRLHGSLERFEVGMASLRRMFGRDDREVPLRLKDGDAFSLCLESYGITSREGEIVRLLIEGRTNEEIAALLFISNHTVKNHVHNVYKKLGIGNRVQLIQRFRLRARGERTAGPRRAGRPVPWRAPPRSGPDRPRRRRAGGGLPFARPGKRSPRAVASRRSIAVLPSSTWSAAKDHEYLCDGISETLIDALTHIDGLWVPARTSAFFFKGKARDLRDVGEKLGVEHVLEERPGGRGRPPDHGLHRERPGRPAALVRDLRPQDGRPLHHPGRYRQEDRRGPEADPVQGARS